MDKLTLRVPFSQAERKLGRIGRDGEAIVRQVLFDCRDVLRGWDSASIVCAYWRPEDDAPYLVPLTEVESGVFAFVVRQEDVAKVGTVRMELRRIDGESVLKSATYTATVEKSINASPVDPGSPEEDMLTELGEAAGQATMAAKAANEAAASVDESKAAAVAAAETANTAASNADASAAQADAAAASAEESASKADASAAKADTATTSANDAADKATAAATSATESAGKADTATSNANSAAASANTSAANADTAATNAQNVADTVQAKLDAGELKGEKGDQGIQGVAGTDGISPTVTTSKADGVTTVTIPDKDGAHTATIEDGAKGDTGADGYSPTATVTKSGTTTTVTVTDKSGTTTAEVVDGSDAAVTKDNIVSALGYEPVKPEGNYELIEEITLTEDTAEIVRTQEPDGTAYQFKALIIAATGLTKTNNSFAYWWANNDRLIALGRFSNVTRYTTILRGFMMGGLMFAIGADEAAANVRVSQCNAATTKFDAYPKGYIDYVKFTASSAILSGTVVKIYGIRA